MSFELFEITLLTIKIAAVATILMIPFGIAIGFLLSRWRWPGKALVESLILLPMILPPVAVGLALLTFLSPNFLAGRILDFIFGQPLLLTWQAAALASFVVSMPLLIKASQQAFQEVPLRHEQLALTLGHSRISVFRKVTLPLAVRGITHGIMLAFTRSLGEFGATALVAGIIPGKTETLALGIYARINNGNDDEAWILSGVAFGLALVILYLGQKILGNRSPIRHEQAR